MAIRDPISDARISYDPSDGFIKWTHPAYERQDGTPILECYTLLGFLAQLGVPAEDLARVVATMEDR